MNPQVIAIIKQSIYRLPGWAVSIIACIFGTMVALNIITWDALCIFFDQPFDDWFGELFNFLMGGLIAAGGIAYDPRAEKVEYLTEVVRDEQ